MKHYDATVVVPTNFVFFTISAILSGRLYRDVFIYLPLYNLFLSSLFSCLMSQRRYLYLFLPCCVIVDFDFPALI